jgi:hypothetical protein
MSHLSTGPRSAEGKAVSRLNALKTGIYAKAEVVLPHEKAEHLAALAAEYHQRFAPTTPEQRCLVDSLVSDEWLLRRFRAIEAEVLMKSCESITGDKRTLGEAYDWEDKTLERLQRRINATRRSFEKTLATLNQLRAQTSVPAPEPKPVQPVATPAQFVPTSRPDAPAQTQDIPAASSKPAAPARPRLRFGESPSAFRDRCANQ